MTRKEEGEAMCITRLNPAHHKGLHHGVWVSSVGPHQASQGCTGQAYASVLVKQQQRPLAHDELAGLVMAPPGVQLQVVVLAWHRCPQCESPPDPSLLP
jgi:hypothetical protein